MSRRVIILGLCVLLIGGVIAGTLLFKRFTFARGMPPAVVEAAPAKAYSWQQEVQATGTLFADQGVMLKSEVNGRVTQISFKPGDNVTQGAVLIQQYSDILKAKLAAAIAQHQLSEANYQRAVPLYKKHVVAKADLDKVASIRDADKANMEMAQASLDQVTIRAPFAGRIGLNLVNVGDYVSSGKELVSLQVFDPLRVDFSVPEIYLGKIALGQAVSLRARAFPDHTFTGKLVAIDSAVNQNTRSIAVRASIPNKNQQLIPGGFVEVTLFLGNKKEAVLVPQTAVVDSETGSYVYKIVNNHASKTPIHVAERLSSDIVITQGLKAGEIIVTAGQLKLMDGAPVIISPIMAR